MFLITTSYKPSWCDQSDKVLFAGEWCRLFDDKGQYKASDYAIFPYHWLDQKKLYRDIEYLDKVYEKYLERLFIALNSLHGVSHSKRYWRIILGPWLNDFIRLLYDYYVVIQEIDRSNLVTNTFVSDNVERIMTPQTFSEFHELCSEDLYNHCLFSFVIKEASNIPYKVFHDENRGQVFGSRKMLSKLRLKRVVKGIASLLYSSFLIPERFKRIVFVSSYFSRNDLVEIQKRINHFPMTLLFDPIARGKNCDSNARDKINLAVRGDSSFESLLNKIIPLQIPIAYIENYKDYRLLSKIFFPKSPKAIFTANAYYYNESFKYWSARQTEGTCKLLISQHGAYGESLWSVEEGHMIQSANLFYTWGWGQNLQKVVTMPSNKLNYTKRLISQKSDKGILCIVNSDVINNMHSQKPMLVDRYFREYVEMLASIPGHISREVRGDFKYRLYHTNYNRGIWGVKDYLVRKNLIKYVGNMDYSKGFYQDVSESKLVIVTYHPNATGLETLSANFPTLLFWDNEQLGLRGGVQKYYDSFERVGIYHKTLDSLVSQIEKIYYNLDEWWYSSEVQKTVKEYCEQFANTSDNCIDVWTEELARHK